MKRFTETNKWRDAWFRRLSAGAKLVWIYLTENCDSVGMIEIDLGLLSSDCGMKITAEHLGELSSRLQKISAGRFFIPKFIPFQYGELSEKCPPHKTVLRLIEIHQLRKSGLVYLHPTGSDYKPELPVENPPPDKPPTLSPAMQIYDAYPRKLARGDALKAIEKALKKMEFAKLLAVTQAYAAAMQGEDFKFVPYPANWYNAEHYFDDPAMWKCKPADNNGAASVFEIKTVLEAKEKAIQTLKNQHATETALGMEWDSDESMLAHKQLRIEVKQLAAKLAAKL